METQPLRILLVEDDGSIARVIAIAMQGLGQPYQLDQAYTAEEGLELWDQGSYDLVLSDYNLRGMNGIAMIDLPSSSAANTTGFAAKLERWRLLRAAL